MPSAADALKGFFLTQLSANLNSLGSAEDASVEWSRRWILNDTTIDANGLVSFGPVTFFEIAPSNTVTIDESLFVGGVASFVSNGSVNTVNFFADSFAVGSNTTFLKAVVMQAVGDSQPGIEFSNDIGPSDCQINRVFASQINMTGNPGGGFGIASYTDAFYHLFLLNDTGGIGFANGTNGADTYLSRISPGILGIGQTGYGTFDANLQVSLLNANTLTVAGLSTLTGLHVAGNTLFTQRLGVGGTFAGSVNGDITVARSTNPVNTGAIYLGTDGNGYLFRSNSSSMTIPLGLVVGLLTVNSTVVTINTVTAITTTALCNGVANTLHFTNGLLTSVS